MKHLRWPLAAMAACAALAVTAVPASAASYGETGDAGQTRATAELAVAHPLTAITGHVAFNSVDMYRVCSSGGGWAASTSTGNDPMLWLFDANGNTVAFNDDHGSLESFISGNAAAGTYYLAIARFSYGYGGHHSDSWPSSGNPNGSGMGYTIHLQGLRSCVQDPDTDNDGVNDNADNCPQDANPGQENNDGDSEGDACDADDDNDGVDDDAPDNCQFVANPDQKDVDGDGQGTACDSVEMPKTTDECKNDGWREFHDGASRFKNQGDCVSWVATEGRNEPAGS